MRRYPLKKEDFANLGISLAALGLSIYATVSEELHAKASEHAAHQLQIYDAYHLGQAASAIYAYARTSNKRPTPSGTTGDAIADAQIAIWTLAAQGYAQTFGMPSDRFVTFRNILEGTDPAGVSAAFDTLNSSFSRSDDRSVLSAYQLGWQTALVGISVESRNADISALGDYRTIRSMIESRLRIVGVSVKMPLSVANQTEYADAMKNVISTLNALPP